METTKISKNQKDTREIAVKLLNKLKEKDLNRATVIFLSGELGAGKTALTREIAEILKTTDRVQSPTFVIMRNLKTKDPKFQTITHIDAYRLEKDSELGILEFENLKKDQNRLIIIEWPENISGLREYDAKVLIKILSDNEREFYFNFQE